MKGLSAILKWPGLCEGHFMSCIVGSEEEIYPHMLHIFID